MKKTILYAAILLLAVACKTKETTNTDAATTSSGTADFPYTLEKGWNNWQTGDPQNAVILLKMIKAWETKNVEECVTYFADSVVMSVDYYHAKLSNDSIASFLNGTYTQYKDLKVEMQDWESVISEDKKSEWATVWYKQSWTDAKGVADSIQLINEAKIENGKITVFDEYSMHYPAAAKK